MRKIRLIAYSLPLCILTMTGCKDTLTEQSVPELEIAGGQNVLTVPAEGGTQTIAYTVRNPVEGGRIEAQTAEGWINSFDYETENQIIFNVDSNITQGTAAEDRSQILTITYIYGEGSVVKQDINVIQSGERGYDFDWEMSVFRGVWKGNKTEVGGVYISCNNYRIWISDTEWSDDNVKPGGTYYQFEIYAPQPEDESVPQLPAGTYTLGGILEYEEWTFDGYFSRAFRYDENGEIAYQAAFQDGTATVSYEDGMLCIDAVLTDTEGKLHHAAYKGEGPLIDESPEEPGLGKDLNIIPTYAASTYIVHYEEEYMEIDLRFNDFEVNNDTLVYPATELRVDAYMAFDKYGYLQTGTYHVGTNELPFVSIGQELFLGMLGGTCVQHLESEDELSYAFIVDGTMTVEGGWGNYTISCDFICNDGYKITCSWSGELKTIGMPGNTSTLEGDYTLNLDGAEATGFCWGDFRDYNTQEVIGQNWFIQFNPGDGKGDGFMMDFVSGLCDPAEGIPTGTYTAAESQDLAPWRYLKGAVVDGTLLGTAYMGDFNENGNPTSYAPAVSGDMNITNNGDGTYHIQFEFLDDKGNTWDGEWSGSFSEMSSAPVPRHTNYVELPDNGTTGTANADPHIGTMPFKYYKGTDL